MIPAIRPLAAATIFAASALFAVSASANDGPDGDWSLYLDSDGDVGVAFYGGNGHYRSGYGRGAYYGRYNNYGHGGYYGSRRDYYGRGHRGHRGYHGRGHRGYYEGSRRGGYGRYEQRSDCHAVSKVGYWHGHKALIGGTMCYDRYGNSYVVDGSRYLIRYY